MPALSLDEQLIAAIRGVNEQFEATKEMFLNGIAELASAVEKASGGRQTVKVTPDVENNDGRLYILATSGEAGIATLLYYWIPMAGFPISVGTTRGLPPPNAISLGSYSDFQSHLGDLVTNPSSPLVVRLAFILRKSA